MEMGTVRNENSQEQKQSGTETVMNRNSDEPELGWSRERYKNKKNYSRKKVFLYAN